MIAIEWSPRSAGNLLAVLVRSKRSSLAKSGAVFSADCASFRHSSAVCSPASFALAVVALAASSSHSAAF